MKQLFNLMICIATCFGSSACSVELKDKAKSTAPAPRVKPLAVLTQLDLVQDLRGLDKPNQYELQIRWPEFFGELRISHGGQMLDVLLGEQGQYLVDNIEGGAKLSYLIEQIVDGRIKSSFILPVNVPRDFELNGISFLQDDQIIKAERVFLGSDTVVFTREYDLQIHAKELISDGASLRNFTESDGVSEREKNGKAGGKIELHIGRAVGQLEVELSGEAAGRGRDGARVLGTGHRGCWGTSGGNGGDAGQFILDVRDDNHFRYHIKSRPGLGGLAGARGTASVKSPRSESVFPCHTKGPGNNGTAGRPGKVCIKRGLDQVLNCRDL